MSILQMKTGAELISAERQRQITGEKWTPEHDDAHTDGELGIAAWCYQNFGSFTTPPRRWPWAIGYWKPSGSARALEKAGALYQAEIDRLTRRRDECAAEIDRQANEGSREPTPP